MIVADRKPLEEIIAALEEAKKILVVGCGTCVAVCRVGGEKEVGLLAAELRLASRFRHDERTLTEAVVQRQCEAEFVDELTDVVPGHDAILSLGCGAGTQFLAQRFSPLPVVPAVNTQFIGVTLGDGDWSEYCQACGDCVLHLTGGICPIARCSKSLLNGPCGGSAGGSCEIDSNVQCGWQLIYDRLTAQGRADRLGRIIKPKNWQTSRDGGPRRIQRQESEQ
jgi:ferredoxin